jgi:hypothetical protein
VSEYEKDKFSKTNETAKRKKQFSLQRKTWSMRPDLFLHQVRPGVYFSKIHPKRYVIFHRRKAKIAGTTPRRLYDTNVMPHDLQHNSQQSNNNDYPYSVSRHICCEEIHVVNTVIGSFDATTNCRSATSCSMLIRELVGIAMCVGVDNLYELRNSITLTMSGP